MLYHSKLIWKAHLSIPFCFRATSIILSCSFFIRGNISYFSSDKMPQHKTTEVSEGKRIGIYFGIKDDQSIKLETNFTNEKYISKTFKNRLCLYNMIEYFKFNISTRLYTHCTLKAGKYKKAIKIIVSNYKIIILIENDKR